MKKLITLFMMSIMMSSSLFATRQPIATVKGTVVESGSGDPLGFATVAFLNSEGTVLGGTAADEKGEFSLKMQYGDYKVVVSMIGYKDTDLSINVHGDLMILDPFTLEPDTEMLSGATVTSRQKLIEVKMDKLVMNISQSAYSTGTNALELMRKAPGVTIDKDGNVMLNGQAVSVWIDGRPSYMSGKSLEALLRSTDSGSIEKFEIMAHPSSKYDAAGQGGIINIKTKKNTLDGLNGNAGFDAGGMYFSDIDKFQYKESVWANFNYKANKSRTFVNLYHAGQTISQKETVENSLEAPGYTFGQNSSTLLDVASHNYQVKLGNDWFVNDKNTFGFIMSLPGERSSMGSDRKNSIAEQFLNGELVEKSETALDQVTKAFQGSGNLNYTHVFDPMRASEITFNLDYYRQTSNDNNNMDVYTMTPMLSDDWNTHFRSILNSRTIDIYSAKADYQTVLLKKMMFEAGAKWALSSTGNEMNHSEDVYAEVNDYTKFDYREHVAAAYFNVAKSFGQKVSAKVGLRGEYTNQFGDWISDNTKTKKQYFDVFPTVFVGYNGEKVYMSLSYTRRITRPNYNQLNPTMHCVGAHEYVVGSAEIAPSYTDGLAFMTRFGQYVTLAAIYQRTGDYIMQNPSFNDNGDEIFTWGNFGSNTMAGGAVSITELPITKWLNWTFSSNALYARSVAKDSDYKNSSPLITASTNFTFNLPKDWKIQIDGTYQSTVAMAYFKVAPTFISNLGVRKNLLSNKLILSINVDDVFRSYNSDLKLNNVEGVQKSVIGQKPYVQTVRVGLDWNFGKAHQTRARNVGNLDEISRAGNSTSIN
ncbi:MAG: outer membrane beta-barrel protein [Bacteroidales bacterium]|nr:outer membrane beta-barrel protein [Bacteroidales bacterium]